MSIFQDARPEMAYLKLGIYGESGTGKTYTSTLVTVGLHRHIKATKPVYFLDTETGSDFVLPRFRAAGIALRTAKTRAFSDLLAGTDEAEKEGSVLIVDSITHFWNELVDAYLRANNRKRLALKDWQPIKQTWREFTDRFVNSRLHIIVAGRSADKWDEVEDEDGVKELRKTGTKMRAETELSYEPSLLVEMELLQLSARVGGTLLRRGHVRKDRFDIIDGQHFDNPTFESFLPHIERLNLGGEHKAIEPGRDSRAILEDPNIGEKRATRKEILLEKVKNEIQKLYPGQNEKDKLARISLMEETFGTNSWTEISTFLGLEKLEDGLTKLTAKLAQVLGTGEEKIASPAPIEPTEPKPVMKVVKGGKK